MEEEGGDRQAECEARWAVWQDAHPRVLLGLGSGAPVAPATPAASPSPGRRPSLRGCTVRVRALRGEGRARREEGEGEVWVGTMPYFGPVDSAVFLMGPKKGQLLPVDLCPSLE